MMIFFILAILLQLAATNAAGGGDDNGAANACDSNFITANSVAGGAGTASGSTLTFSCTTGTASGVATCTDGKWDSPTCTGGCTIDCPPGNVYDPSTVQCAGCWAGFFHENGGTSKSGKDNTCDICPSGFVTPGNDETGDSTVAPGAKKCSSCPSGRFFYSMELTGTPSNFHSKSEADATWFNDPGTPSDYLSPPSCNECMAGKARIGRTCCTDCRVEGCECNTFNGYCEIYGDNAGTCMCNLGFSGRTCDTNNAMAPTMPMGYAPSTPQGYARRLAAPTGYAATMPMGYVSTDVCAVETDAACASSTDCTTVGEYCEANKCTKKTCSDNSNCTKVGEYCDTTDKKCVECTDCEATGCDDMCGGDNVFCDGTQLCAKCTNTTQMGCDKSCGGADSAKATWDSSAKTCTCAAGWKGDHCDVPDCDCTTDCTDKPENAETCDSSTKRWKCNAGYLGDQCQTVCTGGCCSDGCGCQNGGKCVNKEMDPNNANGVAPVEPVAGRRRLDFLRRRLPGLGEEPEEAPVQTTCQCATGFYGVSCEKQCTNCGDTSNPACQCGNGGWCSKDNQCMCQDGWEGAYCTDVGCQETVNWECKACGTGLYAANNGSSICIACPVGQFGPATRTIHDPQQPSDTDTSGCKLCPKGYHVATKGASECVACTAGTYSKQLGQRLCNDCAGGKTSANAALNCTTCSAGTVTTFDVTEGCVPCGLGKFNDEDGQTACKNCGVGQYNEKAVYKFNGTGAIGTTLDMVKQAGNDLVKQTTDAKEAPPKPCFAEEKNDPTYCKNGGSCPPNDFVSVYCACPRMFLGVQCELAITKETPSISCKQCSVGLVQPVVGATSCDDCKDGHQQDEKGKETCDECAKGKYQTAKGKATCTDCPTGKSLDLVGSKIDKCLDCGVGYYQDEPASETCKPCAAGTFNKDVGMSSSSDCVDCPIGWMISYEGASACVECTFGKFLEQVGQAACEDCLAGTFGDQLGQNDQATGCKSCPSGFWNANNGAIGCIACDEGKKGTGEKKTTADNGCEDCPQGKYLDQLGQSQCKHCSAGRYSAQTGMKMESNCVDCTEGQHQKDTGQASCDDCEKGNYQPEIGLAYCLPCVPGEYQDIAGKTSCKKCGVGQYTEEVKTADECKVCPTGWSSKDGSAKCEACGAGEFGNGCKKCPKGFAREGDAVDATQCQQCELGQTTTKEGTASCSGCDLGSYGSSKGVCSTCSAGQYQDGKGETECKTCSVDTYSNEEGKSSKADCIPCSEDRTTGLEEGQSEEDACLCKAATKTCDPTLVSDGDCGYYTNSSGECQFCPMGGNCTLNGMSADNISATNGFWRPDAMSIIFVDCAKGIYPGSVGPSLANARCCPAGHCDTPFESDPDDQCKQGFGGPACKECAKDHSMVGKDCLYCEGGPDLPSAFAALGVVGAVWSLLLFLIFRCKMRVVLKKLGKKEKADETANQDKDIVVPFESEKEKKLKKENAAQEAAATGVVGAATNPTASSASTAAGDKVKKPHNKHQHGRKVGAATAAGRMGREQMFNARIGDAAAAGGQTKMEWDLVAHQCKIMLTSLQIMSAICVTFDDIPWPQMFKDFTFNMGVVNLDIAPLFGMTNCRLSLPFLDKMLLHLSLPLVLIGCVFVLYFIFSRCCVKKEYAQDLKHAYYATTSKIIITTVLLLYPGICVRTFQVFKCKTLIKTGDLYLNSPSLSVLQQDFRVGCFSAVHLPYITVAGVALGVYVVSIPLLLFHLLRKSKPFMFLKDETKSTPKHAQVKNSYGSLYLQYEDEYWWWELTVMVKKMLLTGAMVVISPGTSMQILVGLFIAIAYMLCVLKVAPFLEDADDWLSFSTSVQLVITLLMGLILKLNATDYPEGSVGMFLIGMQLCNFFIFLVSLIFLLPHIRKKLKSRQRVAEHKLRVKLMEQHQMDMSKVYPLSADGKAFVPSGMLISDSDEDSDEEKSNDLMKGGLKELKQPKGAKLLSSLLE